MAQNRDQIVRTTSESLALDLTDPSRVSMTLPAEQTQGVMETIDDTLFDSQSFVARRHPALPSNIIGVEYVDPQVFAERPDLREEALRLEAHRGTRGFSPNTVSYIYDNEGKMSLAALELVVNNYKIWYAGQIPQPPRLH